MPISASVVLVMAAMSAKLSRLTSAMAIPSYPSSRQIGKPSSVSGTERVVAPCR